jgi:hypothetical protein
MVAAIKVIHGANDGVFALPTRTPVTVVRASLIDAFNIPGTAVAFANGARVRGSYRLLVNDTLEFIVPIGRKGAGSSGGAEKRPMYHEEAKNAAEEIRQACEHPESLIVNLARLVRRQKRKGVISDLWSYRNQLLVLHRGYSQARGHDQWAKVGRKVEGRPFFIVTPRFGTFEDIPKTKTGKPKKNAKPVKTKRLTGFTGVPVYGLEQTTPVEDFLTEEKYTIFPDPKNPEFIQVFNGYKVSWWKWYEQLRPNVEDKLTGLIGAAIVANCLDDATEFDDLLHKLKGEGPVEIAKRIEKACSAALDYLTGKDPK